MLNILEADEPLFSSLVVDVELAELVNVVVEVGFNFGLLHKLSAPPCKNQGGNGLLVVVAKTRCAHAKCTSTYLLVPGQGSPKTSEFTGIRHSCF